ncbi:MAG: hypothetical protein R3E09_01170 [Novosphingobium sp.]
MAEVIALPRFREPPQVEMLRKLIVCGCALALIAAGQVLPF